MLMILIIDEYTRIMSSCSPYTYKVAGVDSCGEKQSDVRQLAYADELYAIQQRDDLLLGVRLPSCLHK